MTKLSYYVADAFTPTRFLGNPAAVVPDADGLANERMHAIAAEINLSETSFVLRPTTDQADIRIRWFTPQTEVKMCGHATLAAAHVLRQSGAWSDPARPLRIETASGVLTVELERTASGEWLWLRMPTPRLVRATLDPTRVAQAAGIAFGDVLKTPPLMVSQDRDLIVPIRNCQVLQAAQPDFANMTDLCRRHHLRGVCLTTREAVSAAVSLQSRFFAPVVGIPEDPVTGSVHGPLAAYLLLHDMITLTDDQAIVQCLQTPASGRVGMVRMWLRQDPDGPLVVKVGGQCLTTMRGELYVD